MSFLLFLLAQSSLDPLAGASGWVGTGLLGAVLSWLLFVHLPAKDKQLKELVDSQDVQLKELLDAKDKMVEAIWKQQWVNLERMESGYRSDLKLVAEHCKTELETVIYQFNQELIAFRELLSALRALIEPRLYRRPVDKDEGG